jgi:AcrR family transcriptional regulator
MPNALKQPTENSGSTDIKVRRQEEILEAATALFAECGYADADTQTLADRLGVGKGTIYRYFPSKRELFLAAVDRLMLQLHLSITDTIKEIQDPIDRLLHAINAYLTYFKEHPEIVELMIQERASFKDRDKPSFFENQEKFSCEFQEQFKELVAAGRVRDIPFEKFHAVLGDLLYGTMFTNYFARRNRPAAEQAHDINDIALYGILTDSERENRRKKKAE